MATWNTGSSCTFHDVGVGDLVRVHPYGIGLVTDMYWKTINYNGESMRELAWVEIAFTRIGIMNFSGNSLYTKIDIAHEITIVWKEKEEDEETLMDR